MKTKFLSSSHSDMKPHYDAIVIGSGYGGGVSASRLSRAGQTVCILERGKEFMLGEFPDTFNDARQEVQFSGRLNTGDKAGLYHFHVDNDINVLTGYGLGGTSLINANVVIEADPRVFDDQRWPKAIKEELNDGIKKGYTLAREMLNARPYPTFAPGYPPLEKNKTHEMGAKAIPGAKYRLTDLAVNFQVHPDGKNHVGIEQEPCINCGDCVTGCNVGAKNTVQMTYLPDAYNYGAEIYTLVQVQYIEKSGEKWVVHFKPVNTGRDVFDSEQSLFVTANTVVLSAGSLGSTEILLRSRDKGLSISSRLGYSFSGNGDTFGFAYNTDYEVNGVGWGSSGEKTPVGPCITAIADTRGEDDYKKGLTIEEGVIPGAMGPLLPLPLSLAGGKDTDSGLIDNLQEATRVATSLAQGPYTGAVKNTKTFLVMGHDSATGRIELDDDNLRIRWPGAGHETLQDDIQDKLLRFTKALGGTFIANPLRENPVYNALFGKDLVTVHPLGGCSMGETAKEGVVNYKGQVFSNTEGTTVHEGLYVCDGSIVPAPVGTNPLLTITALSEFNMAQLMKEREWPIDYQLPSSSNRRHVLKKPGVRFTETMKGYLDLKDTSVSRSAFHFIVTIESDDLESMLKGNMHEARLSGTVEADALSQQSITVSQGVFNLFYDDAQASSVKKMRYRMVLNTQEGKQFYLDGTKTIKNDYLVDLWADTTTLSITVYKGTDANQPVVGTGVLRIRPTDLARQLTTLTITNVSNNADRLRYMTEFGRFFVGSLYDVYGQVTRGFSYFDPSGAPRKKRPLRLDVSPEVHFVRTQDGETLQLTRYEAGSKGPVILMHGLGVSSEIFSTDTTNTNLLEYLANNDYDVWLLDVRFSIKTPAKKTEYTADTVAQFDYPAAIDKVIAVTGSPDVQVITHCFGAATFSMSVLGGYTPAKLIRSAVFSQVAAHMTPSSFNRTKAGLYLPDAARVLGIDALDAAANARDPWWVKLADTASRLLPISLEERCQSPVCHRIFFMYGQLYEHDNISRATHDNLHELFGRAQVGIFSQLAAMLRARRLVDHTGKAEPYMKHLNRISFPSTFISGEENECFLPETTARTQRALQKLNPEVPYKRIVVPEYGHIDCIFGSNAARDVYPIMLKQLEATPRGRRTFSTDVRAAFKRHSLFRESRSSFVKMARARLSATLSHRRLPVTRLFHSSGTRRLVRRVTQTATRMLRL